MRWQLGQCRYTIASLFCLRLLVLPVPMHVPHIADNAFNLSWIRFLRALLALKVSGLGCACHVWSSRNSSKGVRALAWGCVSLVFIFCISLSRGSYKFLKILEKLHIIRANTVLDSARGGSIRFDYCGFSNQSLRCCQ